MEHVELNDGNRIPAIGFGVFMVPDGGPTHEATLAALKAGYRHIDTAAAYMNEGDVGRAVRDSGVPRDQIWVTTKLWPQDYAAADAPAVNQVECNPLFQQRKLRDVLDPLDVVLECWYPLGHGSAELLGNPTIVALAERYDKNAGQIILRFETQEGMVALPKSTNPKRIATNLDVFDFELTDAEMDSLRALDTGHGTHDPEDPANEERLLGFRIH